MEPQVDPFLALAPTANIWSLPGQGIIAHFDTGQSAFPGDVALACANSLAAQPLSAASLFETLARLFNPNNVIHALHTFREGGLICEVETDTRHPPLSDNDLIGFHNPKPVLVSLSRLESATWPAAPWVPVASDPQQITIGPLFRDTRDDPCKTCIAARTTEHDDLSHLIASNPQARKLQTYQVTYSERAAQKDFLQRALYQLPSLPVGAILIRLANGTEMRAKAVPRGGCPTCQTADAHHVETGPAVLRDGGYRPLDAATLLPRLESVVDPITGIVRGLTRPVLPEGTQGSANVIIARHAFPLANPDLSSVLRNRRGRSAGKGQTPDEARAGAIAEALECYAGVSRASDKIQVGRTSTIEGSVITPAEWALFSDEQFENSAEWRALGQPAAWVPEAIDPDARLAWTEVTDLVNGDTAWAPAALCWHQFVNPTGCAVPGQADSNGCAAGQGQTDAQLQGLLELIERDAVGIWWWRRSRRPQVAPESFDNSWVLETCAMLRRQGYLPALQDLTHDLGVPVIAAIAWPVGGLGPLLLGFGAHPSAELAAARALTEVIQALPATPAAEIGGDPRRGFGRVPGTGLDDCSPEEDLGFLVPQEQSDAQMLQTSPVPDTASKALATLSHNLTDKGLRIWTLNQSRPDVPLPVVRMIVPGLRHFRPRFAKGRLQSVPEHLGWSCASSLNRLFIRQ